MPIHVVYQSQTQKKAFKFLGIYFISKVDNSNQNWVFLPEKIGSPSFLSTALMQHVITFIQLIKIRVRINFLLTSSLHNVREASIPLNTANQTVCLVKTISLFELRLPTINCSILVLNGKYCSVTKTFISTKEQ